MTRAGARFTSRVEAAAPGPGRVVPGAAGRCRRRDRLTGATPGVQRQDTGTAGRIETAQVAVCLGYAAPRGQAQGWRLEQPEPGVLIWHTPAGRTYTTTPTHYPA